MGTMPRLDQYDADGALVRAVQAKDRRAFHEFVRCNERLVRGAIFGVLGDQDAVDDVAQQVWAAVWERAGELRDLDRWRAWLFRLARNAALDAGRSRTRRRKQARALLADVRVLDRIPAPDAPALEAEQQSEVLAAIQSLPALYREPFVLRHVTGWSYRQIADLLEMPVDSVETRLVRARRFLRETLKHRL